VACFIAGQGPTPCPVDVTISFSVVNQRGIAQNADVYAARNGSQLASQWTDAYGRVTLTLEAGDVVHFSRSPLARATACVAPEGSSMQGVTYTVPSNPPSQVTITLPNATGPPYQPQLSPAERWVVGQINAMRAAKGLRRLEISATLADAADATAHDAAVLRRQAGAYPWPPRYCDAVAIDWGWPELTLNMPLAMLDAATSDPRAALAHWTDTSARGQATFSSQFTTVGIGDGGGAWAMFLSDCTQVPPGIVPRCRLTGDFGATTLHLPRVGTGGSPSAGKAAHASARALLAALSAKLEHSSARAWLRSALRLSFAAAGPGRAAVQISAAIVTGATRHSVVVARATVTVRRSGKAVVAVLLTKQGRARLVAAVHAHRALRIRAAVAFAGAGTGSVKGNASVKVRP
jgi:hypothetical protein